MKVSELTGWLLDRSLTRFVVVVTAAWLVAIATAIFLSFLFSVQISISGWSIVVVLQIGIQAIAALLSDFAIGRAERREDALLGSFALSLSVLVILSETVLARFRGIDSVEVLAESTLVGKISCASGDNSCVISYSTISIGTFLAAFCVCAGAAWLIRKTLASNGKPPVKRTILVMAISSILFSFSFLLLSEWTGWVLPRSFTEPAPIEDIALQKMQQHVWAYLISTFLGFGTLMAYLMYLLPRLRFNKAELIGNSFQQFLRIAKITALAFLKFAGELILILLAIFAVVGLVLTVFVGIFGAITVVAYLIFAVAMAIEMAFSGLGSTWGVVSNAIVPASKYLIDWSLPIAKALAAMVLLAAFLLGGYRSYSQRPKFSLAVFISDFFSAVSVILSGLGLALLWFVRTPFRRLVLATFGLCLLPVFWWPFGGSQTPSRDDPEQGAQPTEVVRTQLPAAEPKTYPQQFGPMRLNCDPWSVLGQPRWAYNSYQYFDSTVNSCSFLSSELPTVIVVFGNASRDDSSVNAFDLSIRRALALGDVFTERYPEAEVYFGVLGRHRGTTFASAFENFFASDRAVVVVGSTDEIPPMPFALASVELETTEVLKRRGILDRYEYCLLGRRSEFENWQSGLPPQHQRNCKWITP